MGPRHAAGCLGPPPAGPASGPGMGGGLDIQALGALLDSARQGSNGRGGGRGGGGGGGGRMMGRGRAPPPPRIRRGPGRGKRADQARVDDRGGVNVGRGPRQRAALKSLCLARCASARGLGGVDSPAQLLPSPPHTHPATNYVQRPEIINIKLMFFLMFLCFITLTNTLHNFLTTRVK